MSDKDTKFWLLVRQALLMFVDAIEYRLGFEETTAMLRKEKRRQK